MTNRVGVDVGIRSVRAVGLAGWGGRPVIALEEARQADGLEPCLARLAKKLPKGSKVTLALPDHQARTHILQLPPTPRRELADAVQRASERWLRGTMAQSVVSWRVASSGEGGVTLLVTLALEAEVSQCVQAAESAGFRVEALQPAAVSVLRAHEKLNETRDGLPRILAWAGFADLTLWMVLDGIPLAHRYAVLDATGLCPQAIDAAGGDGTGGVGVMPSAVAAEVRYFAGAWMDRHPRAHIAAAVLWGDASDAAATQAVQAALRAPVTRPDVLAGSDIHADAGDGTGRDGPGRFAVALGAAWSVA